MNTDAKSFRCPNCGTPLNIPINTRAKVRCPSCGVETLLSGATTNREILEKQNLNSGIPFTVNHAGIHARLYKMLTDNQAMPLDLLVNVKVTKVETFCVPAYLLQCQVRGEYSCDIGNERTRNEVGLIGKNGITTSVKSYTEYTYHSQATNFTMNIVSSGNRSWIPVISDLCREFNLNSLLDIEEISIPSYVTSYPFNMVESVAVSQCEGRINEEIENRIIQDLGDRPYRNLTISGISINHKAVRILLSIICVTCEYQQEQYKFWMLGDGTMTCGDPIEDPIRKRFYEKNCKLISEEPDKLNRSITTIVILVFLCVWMTWIAWGHFVFLILSVAFISVMLIIPICVLIRSILKNEELKAAQEQYRWFDGQRTRYIRQFRSAGKPFKGVFYKILYGKPNIFEPE